MKKGVKGQENLRKDCKLDYIKDARGVKVGRGRRKKENVVKGCASECRKVGERNILRERKGVV